MLNLSHSRGSNPQKQPPKNRPNASRCMNLLMIHIVCSYRGDVCKLYRRGQSCAANIDRDIVTSQVLHRAHKASALVFREVHNYLLIYRWPLLFGLYYDFRQTQYCALHRTSISNRLVLFLQICSTQGRRIRLQMAEDCNVTVIF